MKEIKTKSRNAQRTAGAACEACGAPHFLELSWLWCSYTFNTVTKNCCRRPQTDFVRLFSSKLMLPGGFPSSSTAVLTDCLKKHPKSKILASPNPPKIHPKCLQNRCPQKHAIFHGFLFEKCFVAQAPTSISHWFLQCFLLVEHFSSFRCSHAFWIRKTYQKHFQNEGRTLEKSMSKTYCFPTWLFLACGHDFGGIRASNLEPISTKKRFFISLGLFFCFLKLKLL